MNRRNFLKSSASSLALVAVSAAVTLPLTGCDNATDILNTVLNSADAILQVAQPGTAWAAQFHSAIVALESAEADWKAGSAVAIVISALNTLAAVASVVPISAPYSPLIDVLVAGIDAVLTALAPSNPVAASAQLKLRATPNVHYGRVTLHKHILQTNVGAYKKQFNEAAIKAGLPQAKLK